MSGKQVNFRWDEDLIAEIDLKRGAVSRSAFVERAVQNALASGMPPPESPLDAMRSRALLMQETILCLGQVMTGERTPELMAQLREYRDRLADER